LSNPQPLQVTASRTLALKDGSRYLESTSDSDIIITVPDNATEELPIGSEITIEQAGTGLVTISAAPGVTVNVNAARLMSTNGQFSVIGLKKKAANVWTLFGDLASV